MRLRRRRRGAAAPTPAMQGEMAPEVGGRATRTTRRSRRANRPKRSWQSRLGEFALWSAVAIGTALILISMSESLLPTNF